MTGEVRVTAIAQQLVRWPNPDRRKPLVALPSSSSQLSHALLVIARPECICLHLGSDVSLLGVSAGIVQCRETSVGANCDRTRLLGQCIAPSRVSPEADLRPAPSQRAQPAHKRA